ADRHRTAGDRRLRGRAAHSPDSRQGRDLSRRSDRLLDRGGPEPRFERGIRCAPDQTRQRREPELAPRLAPRELKAAAVQFRKCSRGGRARNAAISPGVTLWFGQNFPAPQPPVMPDAARASMARKYV